MPLVSVVMPVHNAVSTLGASVRSVLAQTHQDLELLITDDASQDGSPELLAELAADDERVRFRPAPERGGAARARNLAIERSRGDLIAFLDSDDMWLPEKLERQLDFARLTRAALTFTSYCKIDPDHTGEAADFVANDRVVRARDQVGYREMLLQNHIGALTAMYDRSRLGRRMLPDIRKRQDYALWLSILRPGLTAHGLDVPLALYRAQRPGSLSSNKLSLVPYNWSVYRQQEELSLLWSMRALAGATWHSLRKARI